MVIESAEGSYLMRDIAGGCDRVRKDGVCGECCASVKSLKRGYITSVVQAAERQMTDCGCLCELPRYEKGDDSFDVKTVVYGLRQNS
jgi:hypothetical protein